MTPVAPASTVFDRLLVRLACLQVRLAAWAATLPEGVKDIQRRTKIHHVYYVLAAFDIATVVAGLLLTHHVIGTLSQTVQSNVEWSQVHDKVSALRGVVGLANAPGNDVFESKDAAAELRRLERAAEAFGPAIDSVRQGIAAKVPAAARPKTDAALQTIEQAMTEMLQVTRLLLALHADGKVDAASANMAVMDRRYSDVLVGVEAASQTLRAIEYEIGLGQLKGTGAFRLLELAIVAMIVVMVVFVAGYGHRVSRLVDQQHAELTSFNAELESRVAARTAELAASQIETTRQREELRVRNHHFDIALNNMNRGLALFDADGRLVVANRNFCDMYGLDATECREGTPLQDILERRAAKGHLAGASSQSYLAEQHAIVAEKKAATRVQGLSDGRVIEVGYYPIESGGWVTTHDDITDRRRMEQQIAHLAHHDALTGLPNRRKLRDELDAALKRAERGDTFAVLCLDLDHFKQINDTLGHPVGDRLLQAVADRLRRIVRKSDLVARLGGDEFAIIQIMSDQPDGAMALATRVIEEISQPYEVDGHILIIGTSVGVVIAPGDGGDGNTLLKNADLALYRAKTEGKGVYRLFELEMDARAKRRRELELDLRRAVALEEFALYFQPLIETSTGAITGFEALLRWRHEERGIVSPADFIPMAEEIGLMGEIGAWVLKTACIEATQWPSHCRVAVNISPAQFRSRPLDLDVMAAIEASGLAPERLELEITETVLLERTDSTMSVLHRLRECGIRIAMDDFGTGYSSLSYLHSFPFDKIKIDRSFTQSAATSSSSLAIVQAVLGLGKSLGMATTAEGVETADQLEHLRREGCAEVQGYLFSRPVPADEIPRLLERLTVSSAQAA